MKKGSLSALHQNKALRNVRQKGGAFDSRTQYRSRVYPNIPQQINETLKEQQMRFPKIVEALNKVIYIIGQQQGISC